MSAPDIERRGAVAGVTASGRTLSGYAATFGTPAAIGGFTERIAPGAFRASLASGRDVLALLDHRADALLGRTRSGSLKLSEDAKGLHFELQLPDTAAARDVTALAERGDLGGMSFGFVATDESWDGNTRELRAVELHEVSIVQSWPAYQQTEINLRSKPFENEPRNNNYLWLSTL
ncbi:HK97 family phage prohead protease [Rhodoferax antarcticus]|uniref:Phage prohead protease, HK97 family n=1 Tax=Rhodoferax antarcticus ANT.BR TaxID=1111071 RepID=A0A1Q8YA53_9BURK|nr:HK97 family phage prohead protease [Rhodoferax antarcticus]APW46920.1 primosome assembly protein PriA [Rhodoferax antarcticus]APW47033.1 primosome assembly protein PriA [Rhodoferax antarcticus]OLP04898.1 phage prohead protease, HK97 family [Rhodoferax antarcticus ANT.BR]